MTFNNSDSSGAGKERGAGPRSSLVHGTDLKLTIIILILCGVIYYVTTTFESVSSLLAQNLPPEWFPRLLIWTIALLSLILPFEHKFLAQGKKGLDEDRTHRIPLKAVLTALLLTFVVASVVWLGTFFAMLFVAAALPLLWGERRWKILVPYIILFPLCVMLLFTKVLKVYFQPGLLGIEF